VGYRGQRDLLRRKAHALQCAGQLDEAAAVYSHAAQLLSDGDAIDLERLHVEVLLRRGRLEEALPPPSDCSPGRHPHPARRPRVAHPARHPVAAGQAARLDYVEREASAIPAQQLLTIDVLYSISSSWRSPIRPSAAWCSPSWCAPRSMPASPFGSVSRSPRRSATPPPGSRNRAVVEAVAARLKAVATRIAYPHIIGLADAAMGIAAHMNGRWTDARSYLEAGLATLRDHGAGVRWRSTSATRSGWPRCSISANGAR